MESESSSDNQELEGQVSNQHQSLTRYPVLPYSGHIIPKNARNFGKVLDDAVIVDAFADSNQIESRSAGQQNVDNEIKEPRGLFYNFDYQVPLIVGRNSRYQRMLKTIANAEFSILGDIPFNKKTDLEEKKKKLTSNQGGRVSQNILDGVLPVHDVQTSPKQKVTEKNVVNIKSSGNLNKQTEIIEDVSRGRGSIKFNTRTK